MLHTERLILRRWRDADRDPFAAMNADPAVVQYLQGPLSRDRSDDFIDRIEAHWAANGWGLWAVEVFAREPFVGYVGLWPADYVTGEPTVEVGWRLAHAHWGRGYASEAARAALRFGFENVALDEIVSFTVPQNERSRHVMDRIGLHRDRAGDFNHPRVDRTRYPHLVRQVFSRLRREDWLQSEPGRPF